MPTDQELIAIDLDIQINDCEQLNLGKTKKEIKHRLLFIISKVNTEFEHQMIKIDEGKPTIYNKFEIASFRIIISNRLDQILTKY